MLINAFKLLTLYFDEAESIFHEPGAKYEWKARGISIPRSQNHSINLSLAKHPTRPAIISLKR